MEMKTFCMKHLLMLPSRLHARKSRSTETTISIHRLYRTACGLCPQLYPHTHSSSSPPKFVPSYPLPTPPNVLPYPPSPSPSSEEIISMSLPDGVRPPPEIGNALLAVAGAGGLLVAPAVPAPAVPAPVVLAPAVLAPAVLLLRPNCGGGRGPSSSGLIAASTCSRVIPRYRSM